MVGYLVSIVLGAAGLGILFYVWKYIRSLQENALIEGSASVFSNPTAGEVLNALESYAWQAIATGERAVVWGLDRIEEHIDTSDKKAVADYWYNLLPDVVVVNGFPIPISVVKTLITQESFETFIKNLYDGFNAKLKTFEDQLVNEVSALKD